MRDQVGVAGVLKASSEPLDQADGAICGSEQQRPGIGRDRPPVNEATTERPSTGAKTSCSGLHCVGIGEFLWPEPSRCNTTTLTYPEPRCTSACEIYGLGLRFRRRRLGLLNPSGEELRYRVQNRLRLLAVREVPAAQENDAFGRPGRSANDPLGVTRRAVFIVLAV